MNTEFLEILFEKVSNFYLCWQLHFMSDAYLGHWSKFAQRWNMNNNICQSSGGGYFSLSAGVCFYTWFVTQLWSGNFAVATGKRGFGKVGWLASLKDSVGRWKVSNSGSRGSRMRNMSEGKLEGKFRPRSPVGFVLSPGSQCLAARGGSRKTCHWHSVPDRRRAACSFFCFHWQPHLFMPKCPFWPGQMNLAFYSRRLHLCISEAFIRRYFPLASSRM